ncbi:hypothetical protein Dimus_038662 [Dionaea muscipula]
MTSIQNAIFLPNVILEESNYSVWVFRLESFLKGLSLYGHIDGTSACPAQFVLGSDGTSTTMSAAYVTWKAQDQSIINMIGQTLSPRAMSCVVGSTTAAELWTCLKSKFADTNKQNVLQLKANLQRCKKGQDSIEVYLEKVKAARDALTTVGSVIEDDDIVVTVLEGLPAEYTAIKTIIRTQPSCSMATLKTLLKAAEYDLEQASQATALFPMTAMVANVAIPSGGQGGGSTGGNSGGKSFNGSINSAVCQLCHQPGHGAKNCSNLSSFRCAGNGGRSSSRAPVECQYCGRKYHTADKCYHLIGFPQQRGVQNPGFPQQFKQSNASGQSSCDSGDNSSRPINTGQLPSGNGNMTATTNALLASGASTSMAASGAPFWIADSGASTHMTSDVGLLNNVTSYPTKDTVTIGNGEGLPISHIGYSNLGPLALNNVLLIPKLKANLLSVHQLCAQNNVRVILDEVECLIQDKKHGKVLYRGASTEGLYPIPSVPDDLVGNRRVSSTAFVGKHVHHSLWHKRLGHPSNEVVSCMLQKAQIEVNKGSKEDESPICEACLSGKFTKLPFPSSQSQTASPFELIHSDVWGPAPQSSIEGFKYFVLFIDDCTRYTWIFPLKNKSDVFSHFQFFYAFVHTQFQSSIKCLRSDGGGEFMSNEFDRFLNTKGILHQLSCPYTPQQNGVAERKNRHIKETAVTMMQQASLPVSFWYHACAFATFLINRMPTPVLGMSSPFEKLFNTMPDLSTIKVFGCAVYPLLSAYNTNKLQAKTDKCVFVGLALGYKGFLCYHKASRRFIISRHVVFDEASYPYANISSTSSSDFTSSTSSPDSVNSAQPSGNCPLVFFNCKNCSSASTMSVVPAPAGVASQSSISGQDPSPSSSTEQGIPLLPTETVPCGCASANDTTVLVESSGDDAQVTQAIETCDTDGISHNNSASHPTQCCATVGYDSSVGFSHDVATAITADRGHTSGTSHECYADVDHHSIQEEGDASNATQSLHKERDTHAVLDNSVPPFISETSDDIQSPTPTALASNTPSLVVDLTAFASDNHTVVHFGESSGNVSIATEPGHGVSVVIDAPLRSSSNPISTSNILHPVEGIDGEGINTHSMLTRAKRGIFKPKAFMTLNNASLTDLSAVEPTGYKSALQCPQWQLAMQTEMDALISQNTWTLVPLPPDKNIVSCKWIFKLKRNADGTISRHKARLVARGFSQEQGVDYDETFSPVVRHTTVRLLLSLAAHFAWKLHQLDVKNAFLHGFLKEEVYMAQPGGFVDKDHPDYVCKLHKSLYGLKQAPRAWNERFTNFLPILGFKVSHADPSLFIKGSDSSMVYLLLYVDDIIITGSCEESIELVKQALQQEFEMTDLGNLYYFLGLEVKYLSSGGIFLCQSKYARDLINRAGMTDCNTHLTPCQAGVKLLKNGESYLNEDEVSYFRSLVGCLQYLTFTRPDISYSVNSVCQFLQHPTNQHLIATKRILKYVQGTVDVGIVLQHARFTSDGLYIRAFCDADWAGDPNDRRSTSGFVIMLNKSPISWCSKKQHCVSRSSTEAEYRAMADTTSELQWLSHLFQDLKIQLQQVPSLHCDNISALALATNPVHHSKLKHIEADVHFTRERVKNGAITLQFVASQYQLADLFTKGLCSPKHSLFCSSLMLSTYHQAEDGCYASVSK